MSKGDRTAALFLPTVLQYYRSIFKSSDIGKLQVFGDPEPFEKPRSVAKYERVHDDAKQIHKVVAEQGPVELPSSVFHDVFAWLLLQLADLFGDVAFNDGCVPGCGSQGGRSDILRDAVHGVHEVLRNSLG